MQSLRDIRHITAQLWIPSLTDKVANREQVHVKSQEPRLLCEEFMCKLHRKREKKHVIQNRIVKFRKNNKEALERRLCIVGAGKGVQCLIAYTALPEDPCSLPSTHIGLLTTPVLPAPEELTCLIS